MPYQATSTTHKVPLGAWLDDLDHASNPHLCKVDVPLVDGGTPRGKVTWLLFTPTPP